jgi:diguanylate cyclase (GGDEF)-like protein
MTEPAARSAPLILVANDQEWSVRSLESILGPNGYDVLRAYTGHQAIERARRSRPDVLILDAEMPDVHGFEVCRTLRDDPRFGPGTPVIITTAGPSGRTQRLDAYRAGAWEFLGQPLDAEALLLKLHTYVAAKRETDRIRDEALLDALTGLYNRRGLARRAREIATEAYRRRHALACLVLSTEAEPESTADAAERIVADVGETLRRAGRVSDAIGRLGPAEFGFIAPATDAEGAVRLAERIGAALREGQAAAGPDRSPFRMRAGFTAVTDYREAEVDPLEMLLRATSALRESDPAGTGSWIRSFEAVTAN